MALCLDPRSHTYHWSSALCSADVFLPFIQDLTSSTTRRNTLNFLFLVGMDVEKDTDDVGKCVDLYLHS